MSSIRTRMALALVALLDSGCGPSPAMAPTVHPTVDTDDDEECVVTEAASPRPVEYVRIDDWQPPPSVRDLESRIVPRGARPPEYLSLPRLTMHREIGNTTIYRRAPYWY